MSGTYECLNCKYARTESVVEIEKGKILPMCAVCKNRDTAWHFRSTS